MRIRKSRATFGDRETERGTLAAAVFAAREDLGLRQEELAELAGCSVGFVRQLEGGAGGQSFAKVVDVLGVLGLGLQITAEPSRRVTLAPAVLSRFEERAA